MTSAASFFTPPELSSARRTVSRSAQSRFCRRLSEGSPAALALLTPRMRTTSGPIVARGREHDRALDGVFELAHVAGPVGRLQRLDDAGFEAVDPLAGALRVLAR